MTLLSDFGIDTLMEHTEKNSFPWLMSNVVDNETGRPLAEGVITHIMDWCGRKIGLVSKKGLGLPKATTFPTRFIVSFLSRNDLLGP